MAELLRDMLTPEVRPNILNTTEHIEASHNEAAEAVRCMKKLITIPFDVTSHGAALHHDSTSMTLPCQIR